MQGRPWASLMPIESTCDGHTDRCTQWLKSPYPRRAMLPRATLSLHPLRGIHDKQACPAAWLPLACCPAFMYPSSKLRQIWDEEKVRVGRLTKLERKLRRENNRVRVRGWKQTNTHVRWGYSTHKTMDWKLMGWSYTLDLMQHWQWPPESLSTIRTGFGALIFW